MAPEIKKTPAIMTPSGGINNTKSERRSLTSLTYLTVKGHTYHSRHF